MCEAQLLTNCSEEKKEKKCRRRVALSQCHHQFHHQVSWESSTPATINLAPTTRMHSKRMQCEHVCMKHKSEKKKENKKERRLLYIIPGSN